MRAGIEVSRFPYQTGFLDLLRRHELTTVVDVGANTGQYVTKLHEAGYRGPVLSVEPSRAAFAQLQSVASRHPDWQIVHAAIAAEPGTVTLNIAGNSQSSSVLPMLELHEQAGPTSAYVATEQVDAVTLDALFAEHHLDPAHCFVKIDVQGFESAVLDGAAESLPTLGGVELELSLAPLYEGQALMPELVERMAAHGLQLWSLRPTWSDSRNGRLLQVDGVFARFD